MRSKLILFLILLHPSMYAQSKNTADQGFTPECVYDTTVYSDESLVNVKVRNNRWVDCYTLQTIINDIFRVEGVDTTREESPEKAAALWKWFRVLICNSVPHAQEGPYSKTSRQREPHKSMTVYGHHECGGLSAPMAALWRAAGYIGYKESSHGHSTVVLRYPDKDGIWRMHAFDPMGGFYWWDETNKRIGVRSCPVMKGTVFRRLEPVSDHTLRTSLRWGEKLRRQWDSENIILRNKTTKSSFFTSEIYNCVAGLETQVIQTDIISPNFRKAFWKDSSNTARTAKADEKAVFHPEKAGEPAAFIYRLPSPYVAVEGMCEATLYKSDTDDLCRLYFSTDLGKTWNLFFDKQKTGKEDIRIDIGNKPYFEKKPSITSAYTILIKAEFKTSGKPSQVGMDQLKVTVKRQLNKRMLMNLLPGKNMIEITADRITPGTALKLDIKYTVNKEPVTVTKIINTFPFYFEITVNGISTDHLKTMRSKVTKFNIDSWPLRMDSIHMQLVKAEPDTSLSQEAGKAAYRNPTPHPYIPKRTRKSKVPAYDMEVTGFFPQAAHVPKRDLTAEEQAEYEKLTAHLSWDNAQKLGAYPQAVDILIKALRRSNGDLTIFICKALAQIRDPKAVDMLKLKWNRYLTRRMPGTRYVPDAIAACMDQSVVPDLIKPLKTVRCDYRFHIIYALGILGGSEAKKTLEYLADNDPHYANRILAKKMLIKEIPPDRTYTNNK
jgi:hypothetical protein